MLLGHYPKNLVLNQGKLTTEKVAPEIVFINVFWPILGGGRGNMERRHYCTVVVTITSPHSTNTTHNISYPAQRDCQSPN